MDFPIVKHTKKRAFLPVKIDLLPLGERLDSVGGVSLRRVLVLIQARRLRRRGPAHAVTQLKQPLKIRKSGADGAGRAR